MKIKELQAATAKYALDRERIRLVTATINPVEMVTPVNLAEVKANWIENANKGVFINPVFQYDRLALHREAQKTGILSSLLIELPLPSSEAEKFIYRLLAEVIHDAKHSTGLARAMLDGNDVRAAAYSVAKYHLPEPKTIVFAEKLLNGNATAHSPKAHYFTEEDEALLRTTQLDAEFIKSMFIWAMEQYGEPWPVEVMDNCSSIDVRDKSSIGHPIIAIPTTRRVNGFKLLELIGHEIECHWLSSQNDQLIGALKVDTEVFYEGVAKLKDWRFGRDFLGEDNLPQPYYTLAIKLAIRGASFAEVGKIMTDYLSGDAKRAWTFTYRVFRGITDTVNKGGYAFTKDAGYLEGFLKVRQMVEDGDAALLSFSTLSFGTLYRLADLVGREELGRHALQDKHIQEAAAHEILRRLKKA